MGYPKLWFRFLRGDAHNLRALAVTAMISILHLRIYEKSEIVDFGYTKSFLGIAKAPLINGKLSSNLTIDSMGLYLNSSNSEHYINVFREPLYPYFLKLCLSLNIKILTIIQIQQALLLLTLFLVFRYFSKILEVKNFWIAALVVVLFCKVPFFYSSVLYPFCLSNFFLILGIVTMIQKKRGNIFMFISGSFLGLSILERQPFLLFLIVFLALFTLLRRFSFRQITIILCGAFVPLVLANSLLASSGGLRNAAAGYNLGYAYGNELSVFASDEASDLSKQLFSNIESLGADSGTLLTIAQIAGTENLGLRNADNKVANLIMSMLFSHPEVIPLHVIKNVFHYSDNLVTRPSFQISHTKLSKFWESFIVGKPRIYSTFKILDFLIFSIFILICLIRIRTISNFSVAVFAFSISQLFLTSFLATDPRYRGISDILIILCLSEIIQGIHRKKISQNV
jgi:hypothetical protein